MVVIQKKKKKKIVIIISPGKWWQTSQHNCELSAICEKAIFSCDVHEHATSRLQELNTYVQSVLQDPFKESPNILISAFFLGQDYTIGVFWAT